VADFDDEIDLRAEYDALVAAEIEAAEAKRAEEEAARLAEEEAEKARRAEAGEDEDAEAEADADADAKPAPRRRGRRGGRGRSRGAVGALEATFDHGEEGYGLWLDPAVSDDPVYSEHWAGHRAVTVTLSAEAITIRRADTDGGSED
jgi:hypothetical protein